MNKEIKADRLFFGKHRGFFQLKNAETKIQPAENLRLYSTSKFQKKWIVEKIKHSVR